MTRIMPTSTAASTIPRLDWMRRGLCTSAPDPDLWFPDPGRSAQPAIAVCTRCPVSDVCLGYALSLPANPAGVWGGTTEEQRRELRGGQAVAERRQQQAVYRTRPEVRERRRQRSAERRARLREAATAGDPQAIATLERQRAAKRTPQALAAARRRARARYQVSEGDAA
jgi:WhiB family redox-sensing transcriptional regulator